MACNHLPFAEGASINRPPLFCGENYPFWKVRMRIFLESVNRGIWQAVVTDYKTPTYIDNGSEVEKPFERWDGEEIKRAENDARALNIIHSALNSDEFFRISECRTAKEAWELIKVTHEGTAEVRRARKNTLIQEYETFRMSQGESIMDMQKRFTHIVNHLKGLGKDFIEEEVNVKILKSLNRKWQPTVTAITESKNLAAMTSAELFGKLREYEMDLTRIADEEQKDKKAKGLALRIENAESETESSEDDSETQEDHMNLMVKKFRKFMKKNSKRRFNPQRKGFKKQDNTSVKVTCYECGKMGHYKSDCPNLRKGKSTDDRKNEYEEKFRKEKNKKKRAYIAWDENDTSSTSESDAEEANLCLMTKSSEEVSDTDTSMDDYDELHTAFCELYKEAEILEKENKIMKKEIFTLNQKINDLNNELSKTRNEHTGRKHTYNCFQKCAYKAARNESKFRNSKHANIVCTYCMKSGHTAFNCMIRKKGILAGMFKWVVKEKMDTNMNGPNRSWVPTAK